MKTTQLKQSEIERNWWHVDLDGQILGRVATAVAMRLIGKHKANYVTHLDCGDYVVLTNVEKVDVTGKKMLQKVYHRHSGYPGGLKSIRLDEQLKKDAREVIKHAVAGMLPKNKLRDQRLKRLKLFIGETHSYTDKKVKELVLESV